MIASFPREIHCSFMPSLHALLMKHTYRYFLVVFFIIGGVLLIQRPAFATTDDRDSDGLSNDAEVQIYGTNPNLADTDSDGIPDGMEVQRGTDPLTPPAIARPLGSHTYTIAQLLLLKGPKRIDVDLSSQTLRYYLGSDLIGTVPVSTGIRTKPTPVGAFAVMAKLPVVRYKGDGYDYPNTKWNLRFKIGYYIHGAYWHNDFGIRPRSHGCVNVSYRDMPYLYAFADVGTQVTIHR